MAEKEGKLNGLSSRVVQPGKLSVKNNEVLGCEIAKCAECTGIQDKTKGMGCRRHRDTCIPSVSAPHIRQRGWWVADRGMENASRLRRRGRSNGIPQGESGALQTQGSRRMDFWQNSDLIPCADGKYRRIESGVAPLAHGLPRSVGEMRSRLSELGVLAEAIERLPRAKKYRLGTLRGYGNAINPYVAAEFIRAYMETTTRRAP